MSRPSKRDNVASDVADRVRTGRYTLSHEAQRRMRQRQVIWPEVTAVLRGGVHVPEYDQWIGEHESWNYAIEGDTVAQDDVLVITVIDVPKRGTPRAAKPSPSSSTVRWGFRSPSGTFRCGKSAASGCPTTTRTPFSGGA